jgi:hypothetical protein
MPPSNATKGRIPLSPRGEFLLPPLGIGKSSYGSFVRSSGGPNLEWLHGTRRCRYHSHGPPAEQTSKRDRVRTALCALRDRFDRPERCRGGRLRLLLSLRRTTAIHHVSARCAENRRNTFLVHFSAGRQRIQDRFTDRAPYSGATNCMASNAGQFSARCRFVRAALRSDDRDYRKIAIEYRISNARQSDAGLSHEF